MISLGGFAYCQARIQARYAALPGASDWQRLAGTRTFAAFIEEARVGPLRPWVKGFSSLSTEHDLERGLRDLVWELVDEISNWVPAPWREPVRWAGWIPLLPVFEQSARGLPLPHWTSKDTRLSTLLDDDGRLSPAALDRAGLTALVTADERGPAASAWGQAWRALWPTTGRSARYHLESLSADLDAHLRAFQGTAPDSAWALRHSLRERLRLGFHRRLMQPATVFIYLALMMLDLERLRAELLSRNLFDPPTQGPGAA